VFPVSAFDSDNDNRTRSRFRKSAERCSDALRPTLHRYGFNFRESEREHASCPNSPATKTEYEVLRPGVRDQI